MKSQRKKPKIFSYNDPELETYIRKESNKNERNAILDARSFADLHLPAAIGDSYYSLVGTFVSNFNEMLAYANERIQGSLNGLQGINDKKVADEQKMKIRLEIDKIREEVRPKEIDLRRMFLTYAWKWHKIIWAGIIAISGIEAMIASKSFQLFVSNLLTSILVALLVWGALIALAHILPRTIRMGRTTKQQLLIGFGCLLVLGIVFYILGGFRIEYLQRVGDFAQASGRETDDIILGISPISFMILNLFFLTVSTLLAFFFLPTKQQQREKVEWDEVNNEVKILTGRIEDLEEEIVTIGKELNFALEKRTSIIAYAKYTEKWIKTLYEKVIEVFKKENIFKRKDGQVPDCFEQPPIELNYYYNDINI